MAAIIDGSTYAKYWKITADDASPTDFIIVPKDSVYTKNVGGNTGLYLITDTTAATSLLVIDNGIEDENGNDLVNLSGLCQYLNDNK